jgi:glutathione synthase/RimK-type ligase-like ATP-grasp enzyme
MDKPVLNFTNAGVRWRVFEKEALEKHFGPTIDVNIPFKDTRQEQIWAEQCEYATWRPNTEMTKDEDVQWMVEMEERLGLKNFNSPKNFYKYHAKDEAFKVWEKEGIPVPPYFMFANMTEFREKIDTLQFPVILRINNACAAEGSYFCKTRGEADRFAALVTRDQILASAKFSHTKMMCVQYINTNKEGMLATKGYNSSYRVIVAGDKVVTGYARLSDPSDWVAITGKFTPDMGKDFVKANAECEEFIKTNEEQIVKAVHSLGLNHQGVDIIRDTDGNPYYLEVQPGYSTGYANDEAWQIPYYNPSYPELVKFLTGNESTLKKEIPLYFNYWLDKERLFDTVYSNLKEHLA